MDMPSQGLEVYRRRLPHWRLAGATYFVTWRLRASEPALTPEERDVVFCSLRFFHGERYELLAGVVMDDHVHVLVRPLRGKRLREIIHSWKSYTAHRLRWNAGRKGLVWQDEYFDRVVRDDRELREKAEYILNNPIKRWREIEAYPWVGFGFE